MTAIVSIRDRNSALVASGGGGGGITAAQATTIAQNQIKDRQFIRTDATVATAPSAGEWSSPPAGSTATIYFVAPSANAGQIVVWENAAGGTGGWTGGDAYDTTSASAGDAIALWDAAGTNYGTGAGQIPYVWGSDNRIYKARIANIPAGTDPVASPTEWEEFSSTGDLGTNLPDVADATARFAIPTADLTTGDIVKQTDNGLRYQFTGDGTTNTATDWAIIDYQVALAALFDPSVGELGQRVLLLPPNALAGEVHRIIDTGTTQNPAEFAWQLVSSS